MHWTISTPAWPVVLGPKQLLSASHLKMVFREPGGASFLFPSHADCDHLSHAGCDYLFGRRLPLRYFCLCPLLGGLYTNLLGFAVVCLVCCSVFFLKAPALPIVPTGRSASHLMPWRIFAHAMMPHCSLRSISPMWMSSPEMEACRPKGLLPPSPGPLGPGPGPLPPNGLWVRSGGGLLLPSSRRSRLLCPRLFLYLGGLRLGLGSFFTTGGPRRGGATLAKRILLRGWSSQSRGILPESKVLALVRVNTLIVLPHTPGVTGDGLATQTAQPALWGKGAAPSITLVPSATTAALLPLAAAEGGLLMLPHVTTDIFPAYLAMPAINVILVVVRLLWWPCWAHGTRTWWPGPSGWRDRPSVPLPVPLPVCFLFSFLDPSSCLASLLAALSRLLSSLSCFSFSVFLSRFSFFSFFASWPLSFAWSLWWSLSFARSFSFGRRSSSLLLRLWRLAASALSFSLLGSCSSVLTALAFFLPSLSSPL